MNIPTLKELADIGAEKALKTLSKTQAFTGCLVVSKKDKSLWLTDEPARQAFAQAVKDTVEKLCIRREKEAGIKRMEALTMDEIFHAYDHQKGVTSEKLNAVRSRLIAAAREGQVPSNQPAEIPWIEWNGGECPLKDEDVLEWECSWPDGERTKYGCKPSDTTGWDHITRYRVTKWREGQPATVDLTEALAIANKSADEQMRFKREAEARAEKAEARIRELEEKNKRQAEDMRDVANRLGIFNPIEGTNIVKHTATAKCDKVKELEELAANEKRKRLYAEEHLGILAKTFGYEGKTWCNMVSYLCPRLQKAEAELADSANALTYISETLDAMGIPSVTAAGDGPGSIGIEQRMDLALRELEAKAIHQLRPISQAGPVPEGCVRVTGYLSDTGKWAFASFVSSKDTHSADIRLPATAVKAELEVVHDGGEVFLIDPYFALKAAHAAGKVIEVAEKRFGGWSPVKENHNWTFPVEEYRIKPESTFEAHGQTWTKHTPGDPMPCDGEALVDVLLKNQHINGATKVPAEELDWSITPHPDNQITGWRYADKPKAPVPVPLDASDIRATDEFRRTGGVAVYAAESWDNSVVNLARCAVKYSDLATMYERRQHGSDEWKPCTKEKK